MTAVEQPSGTVTLVFTDIEGSTRLLDELGVDAYRQALAEHRDVVRTACARHQGYEVDYEGDAFFYAFSSAHEAVSAVSELMLGLQDGPIRVRVGVHTGEPVVDPPKYVGLDVHRAARMMSAAHGGQVVVSPSTVPLLESGAFALEALGEHRLKDLSGPTVLHQLVLAGVDQEFPPLRTLYRTNLPVPATPFVGRERELERLVERLADPDTRLLTLTGPGGTGKTRLALQAASEASGDYPDGVFWVPLAPLADAALVMPAVAHVTQIEEAAGERLVDTVARTLIGKQMLLLLDNAEHLLPELAVDVAALAEGCPTLTVMLTSRERLQLGAEREFPVAVLLADDAVDLLVLRAAAVGVVVERDSHAHALVERLDRLPLAIELAAARLKLFTPAQLLGRLTERLDLLKGARDADPRQHTLRATIDWSYQLLEPDEQRVYGALSVFVDGAALAAAEAAGCGDPDTLQSLLDKSLLRSRTDTDEPRFWMLETIRQHAAERLLESGCADSVAELHAAFYATEFADLALEIRRMQRPALACADAEAGNIRLGLAFSLASREAELVARYLFGLWSWFVVRGAVAEGREYARRFVDLELDRLDAPTRFAGLLGAGEILRHAGELESAIEIKRSTLADVAAVRGAVFHGIELAPWEPALLTDLAHLQLEVGEVEVARSHAEQALALRTSDGHPLGIAHALDALVAVATATHDYASARELQTEVLALRRERPLIPVELVVAGLTLAELELLCGDTASARECLAQLDIGEIVGLGDEWAAADALRVFARLRSCEGELAEAAYVLGAYERQHQESGMSKLAHVAELDAALAADLRRQLGDDAFRRLVADGPKASAFELVSSLAARLVAE